MTHLGQAFTESVGPAASSIRLGTARREDSRCVLLDDGSRALGLVTGLPGPEFPSARAAASTGPDRSSPGTLIASDTTTDGRADQILSDAAAALAPAHIEWANGHSPTGRHWNDLEAFVLGRVSSETGALTALLLFTSAPADMVAVEQTLGDLTGLEVIALTGIRGDHVGDAGSTQTRPEVPPVALAHAAASLLDAIPPAGMGLTFDGVQESGAPLALWNAHPRRVTSSLLNPTTDGWRLGSEVTITPKERGFEIAVASGPFARRRASAS